MIENQKIRKMTTQSQESLYITSGSFPITSGLAKEENKLKIKPKHDEPQPSFY